MTNGHDVATLIESLGDTIIRCEMILGFGDEWIPGKGPRPVVFRRRWPWPSKELKVNPVVVQEAINIGALIPVQFWYSAHQWYKVRDDLHSSRTS